MSTTPTYRDAALDALGYARSQEQRTPIPTALTAHDKRGLRQSGHAAPLLSDDVAACERARLRILAGREASSEVLNALAGLLAIAERCFALTESGEQQKVAAMDAARVAIARSMGRAA